jgi:hypothetical protein
MGIARTAAGVEGALLIDANGAVVIDTGVATSKWSASDAAANSVTLSNGGLTATYSKTNIWNTVRGSNSKNSGKCYIEFLAVNPTANGDANIGLASAGFNPGNYPGASNYSAGQTYGNITNSTGFVDNWTGGGNGPLTYPVTNDVWAIAADFSTGGVWIAKNNVWSQGNPSTGTAPILSFTLATVGPLFPAMGFYDNGTVWTLQPTAASQRYAPPTGFSAWG